MNKLLVLIVSLMIGSGVLQSQIINKVPLSPRITGYKIDATLDVVSKTVTAKMDAYWINDSDEPVPDIQLHLYMNAFRSSKTTVYRESGGSPGNDDKDLGWIEIKSFKDDKGTDLLPLMQYISPDDGNVNDSTVLRIILPQAAMPGDTVFVNIEFETKLPSRIRRTGYNDDFFFVAQWFPKFGVYEKKGMRYAIKGGWNCHQFHPNSEFYSNHSVYDVEITVPKEYIVGSGGMLLSETDSDAEGRNKTLTYRAEDIVDFAWTAWPGYAVYTDQWEHIKITLLSPPERKNQVARQFTAVKNALEYLTRNVGPFPWPHLTFVDPPAKGGGAGGMEYTTLFTSMSSYGMPAFIHMPEMVTVHEFGHAYFMGILASNEFEEPWMDEGLNSFWEQRIMDHYYGENSGMIDHPLLRIPDKSIARLGYVRSGSRQVVSNNEYSWNYPHRTYSMMSYLKTATWMATLMGIVGEETTNNIFREYYRKWAFKHPSGKDFINVVNEVVTKEYGNKFGPDMNWFFDEVLYGTGICDYKVTEVSSRRPEQTGGKTRKRDSLDKKTIKRDTLYYSVAQIERAGELIFPVDVLVHFKDNTEILETWNGKERYKDFSYTRPDMIEWVKIDPEYKIRMDVNFINNSRTIDPDRTPVRRMADKLLLFMQYFISTLTL
jgi:hypothetical protein